MLIECKQHREGGSFIDLDDTEYHFAPNADDAHVADVVNDAHIERLLSISEGYREYKPAKAVEPVETEGDERATLAAQYEAKFSRKPHPKMGLDKMRAELEAA